MTSRVLCGLGIWGTCLAVLVTAPAAEGATTRASTECFDVVMQTSSATVALAKPVFVDYRVRVGAKIPSPILDLYVEVDGVHESRRATTGALSQLGVVSSGFPNIPTKPGLLLFRSVPVRFSEEGEHIVAVVADGIGDREADPGCSARAELRVNVTRDATSEAADESLRKDYSALHRAQSMEPAGEEAAHSTMTPFPPLGVWYSEHMKVLVRDSAAARQSRDGGIGQLTELVRGGSPEVRSTLFADWFLGFLGTHYYGSTPFKTRQDQRPPEATSEPISMARTFTEGTVAIAQQTGQPYLVCQARLGALVMEMRVSQLSSETLAKHESALATDCREFPVSVEYGGLLLDFARTGHTPVLRGLEVSGVETPSRRPTQGR